MSGAGASTGVLSSTLGVARCGGSAGCVLCVLWAVPAAVLRGGYPVGVSISSSSRTCDTHEGALTCVMIRLHSFKADSAPRVDPIRKRVRVRVRLVLGLTNNLR